jgi:hypothetical protein
VATVAPVRPFGACGGPTVTVVTARRGLVTTPEAARELGISPRTVQRYVRAGLITPDLTLPSGRYRWDVARLRDQINALPARADDPDEA